MRTYTVDMSGRTEQAGLRQQALVPWQDHQVLPSLAAKKAKKKINVRTGLAWTATHLQDIHILS